MITPEEVRAQFKQHAESQATSSSGKRSFVSLEGGPNTIRLVPTEGEPLFAEISRHFYTSPTTQKFCSAMDYTFLYRNPHLIEAACASEKITEGDLALYNEHGDPFSGIAFAANAAGMDRQDISSRGLWGGTRYLWRAVRREDDPPFVGLFESSYGFFKQLAGDPKNAESFGLLEDFPELFDPDTGYDVRCNGNGQKGKLRRYESLRVVRDSSSIDVDGWEDSAANIDLTEKAVQQVVPWLEKAKDAIYLHSELMQELGIDYQSWGVILDEKEGSNE